MSISLCEHRREELRHGALPADRCCSTMLTCLLFLDFIRFPMSYLPALLQLPVMVETTTACSQRQAKYASKPSVCLVCGDKARIVNYGAISCSSCKTFFRRHGFRIEVGHASFPHTSCPSRFCRKSNRAGIMAIAMSTCELDETVRLVDWLNVSSLA